MLKQKFLSLVATRRLHLTTIVAAAQSKVSDQPTDKWGITSKIYAVKATYITGRTAEQLVSLVDIQSSFSKPDVTAFDNGCGTGIVTTILRSKFPGIPILAADLSPGMLEILEKKGLRNVQTRILNAMDLHSIKENTFTHTLSNMMVQFTPDPLQSLREMFRVTKIGGTLGLCMLANLCFDAPWVEACRKFDPGYTYPHSWTPDWQDSEQITGYLQQVGFKDIRMKPMAPRWDWQAPEPLFEFFLKSKNPEFEQALNPWKKIGKYQEVEALFKQLVREKYSKTEEWDAMKVFLYTARK